MRERSNYYLGFDIGTNSVGWAVTDENYRIQKFNGKLMWGSRLFDEADTAQERRMHRTLRRRLQRRRWRINLLQELFAEEISKVDMGFYQRLKDGALLPEDKKENQIYTLFHDTDFNDTQFYKKYPTIYHLRKALITETDKKDIRLIYLALHHIMKHRGHFLYSGSVENATSFRCAYDNLVNCLEDEFGMVLTCDSEDELSEVIRDKRIAKRDKAAKVLSLWHCEDENRQKQWKAMIEIICGSKVKLSDIFDDETLKDADRSSVSFSDASYDDIYPELEEILQERCGVLDILKGVYDWGILADILKGGEYKGNSYLSIAKVGIYEKHQEDLQCLKKVIKDFDVSVYREFFQKPGKDNYCAYIGTTLQNGNKISTKRCLSYDDFKKALEKILKKIPNSDSDERIISILEELAQGTFLPLQVSKGNSVIPHQVHGMECRAILKNAEKYYDFLLQKDEKGRTVSDRIMQLFEFRIPYYVGPLNTSHDRNSWMIRKTGAEGRIDPWNFEDMVDVNASAEQFKRRMTNKCTYLLGEDVLPKHSLLYSEFMVWNELNNVKIRNEKLPVELKIKIFEEVFQKNKKVTGNTLLTYLKCEGIEASKDDLSGFDQTFKSSLTSYLDMKKIFGEEIRNYSCREMIENLILWITLYGDAPKMLKQVIRNSYGEDSLSEEQLKKICRLKYQGWGRLSKKFLNGIEGVCVETGEIFSVIKALRETSDNLMQILSSNYTFSKEIEARNKAQLQSDLSFSYDNIMKDLVASPAIKRAAWQVLLITEEIRKIMGKEPLKIFVEMARGPEEKKATTSRQQRLLQLYSNIKDESRDWKAELESRKESDFRSIKLYLYYTQMGKCMYSGKSLDLSQLANLEMCDRDHIYPQSKTKDDSIDNLVLVCSEYNRIKDNGMIKPEWQEKMLPFWKMLKEKGLISETKFRRLTRKTPLTDEELAGFINRQLVETRQSTKVVAELFQRLYENSQVVYVKAKAVADFRNDTLKTVKCRSINDYHHAHDAYLNIVVGNVYHEKFTSNPLQWLREKKDYSYNLNRIFDRDMEKKGRIVWAKGEKGTLQTVRYFLNQRDIRYTRYAMENKRGQNGGLFDSQIVSKNANASIPIKKGMDVKKYGGYKKITPAYFALVQSVDKKGKMQKSIESVPLYLKQEIEKNPERFLEYCQKEYGLNEPKVLIPCIKKDSLLRIDGFPMHLRGTTGKQLVLQGAVQLILDDDYIAYFKKIEKYLQRAQAIRGKERLQITENDEITTEKNLWIYDEFYRKEKETIYSRRPANQSKTLEEGREQFAKLPCEEQCVVLNEILHLLQCNPILANLEKIGGTPGRGKIQSNKFITNCEEITLIHQSVTGLFEQEIDLLAL